MKRHVQCSYCGKWFFSPVKKMWVIWLCDINELETKTEGGETYVIHDKQRVKTCGAFPSFVEAEAFIIPNMEKDQKKEVERIDTVTQNFCNKCLHDAKLYYDRLQKRMKKESLERMKARGVKDEKGEAINPISNKDFKGYLRYLVDSKVKEESQKKLQAEEEEKKKADIQKRHEAELMARREKVLGGNSNGKTD